MNIYCVAAYPKSGSAMINRAFWRAGTLVDPEYQSKPPIISVSSMKHMEPIANPYLQNNAYMYKSHDDLNGLKKDKLYDRIQKIVTCIRNPFDTLLSAINYSLARDSAKTPDKLYKKLKNNFNIDLKSLGTLDNQHLSIDYLHTKGCLNGVVDFFALNNTLIPRFKRSGTWIEYSQSYDNLTNSPVLHCKYELLSPEGKSKTIGHSLLELASFLDCDPFILKEAFAIEYRDILLRQESGDKRVPKAKIDYWKNYLDRAECIRFADKFSSELKALGYIEFLDEIFQ